MRDVHNDVALAVVAGKYWMDALELALRCSGLLLKTMTKEPRQSQELDADPEETSSINIDSDVYVSPLRSQLNESDCERHFEGFGETALPPPPPPHDNGLLSRCHTHNSARNYDVNYYVTSFCQNVNR